MNLIIRAAKVIDPESSFHDAVVDLQIENGIFTKIAQTLPNNSNFKEVRLDNLHISQGWFDSSVCLGEPGFEDRETISNGLEVAAKSGFTAVAMQPNSHPIIDSQSQVAFVRSKAAGSATDLYPIGALTKESLGKDLAELYDMKNAGAVAFGDYNKNTDNPNLLKIALQYTQDFDALVIAFSQDSDIKGNGVVNEGIVSTRLGLKGIPALAEEIAVARNLFLLEYTGGKLHLPTLSTGQSVKLVKAAKAKGLQITCSASVHNLTLTDEKLEGFDSRYKVSPPLRNQDDRKALVKAVKDGTIDMITSDHNPIDIEHKKMEFDLAKNGTIGLESAFGALGTVLPLEVIVEKLTSGKKVFGIEKSVIAEGNTACVTLFNPNQEWVFANEHIDSKSKNAALLGMPMKGKAYGIFNNKKLVLSS